MERAVILSDVEVLRPEDFLFPASRSENGELFFETYNLDMVEKKVIRKAIEKHSGNISKTAEELGLTRASLYRRMEKHEL
jgi:transcriptional regulator of acetoin/glycerol metabolism